MMNTKLQHLDAIGQSIWMDFIQRSLMMSGELDHYINKGLRGLTSNPAIFEKAIAETTEYDSHIHELALAGMTAQEIGEQLAVEDIRMAADALRPVFEETGARDGFVSLEVNPHLAHDKDGTVAEAKRLFATVERPNVMIKVPATEEGLLAFQELIVSGIHVNVTLIFSQDQYKKVAEAYVSALERYASRFMDLHNVSSVASLFVSRMDVKVDNLLDALEAPEAKLLNGKIGIANAKMVYQHFKQTFQGQRWQSLAKKGARVQRLLFGSTSTKTPEYSDVMYVEGLIGPDTVNTLPPTTLDSFLDHGQVAETLDHAIEKARWRIAQLQKFDIDLNDVCDELLVEGLEKFSKPYERMIDMIAQKQEDLVTT